MKLFKVVALISGLFICATSFAEEGTLVVKMKSDDEMSVMVVGSTGKWKFDSENDFVIVGKDGQSVAPIYPFEIFEDRFWSEPLTEEIYKSISEGMEVRAVTLAKEPHWEIRYRGAEFLLYRKKKQVAELRQILEQLMSRTNSLRDSLQGMGTDLARDSERSDELRTVNKLRNELGTLLEDRDSINKKIEDALPRTEKNQKKIDRLTEDLTSKEEEVNLKRAEIEKEENRAGISNSRVFERLRIASETLQNASTEIQNLSTELYNALSHVEYIEQNMQKTPRKP